MTPSFNLIPIHYALEVLKIYIEVNIQRDIEQLNKELQKLNTEKKLKKNMTILKNIFEIVKKERGPYPPIDSLFSRVRQILLFGNIDLSDLVNERAFEKLKERVGEEKAYDILAWGVIKHYIEKERIPHVYIWIKYDP